MNIPQHPSDKSESSPTNSDEAFLGQIGPCPKTGAGVHNWLFRAAGTLHRLDLPAVEITRLLASATTGCGREVPADEVTEAVNNSSSEKGAASQNDFRRWPLPNEEKIKAITTKGPPLADLEALSPHKFVGDGPHSEEVIEALYPGNPLLCLAITKKLWDTRPRETWRGLSAQQQFIVPSPMSAEYGKTKGGKESKRTLENTGPRKYLVIEFDQGTFDEHAAILLHLARFAPLTLAVHSGGKSIHGYFVCGSQNEANLRRFMEYAVSLGADRATWTKSQLVRLPDGTRSNGARQRVIFFNPSILEAK
jgi:hypothetical protein